MNETLATVLGVIGAFMTLLSVSICFFTFYFGRKKASSDDGEFRGSLKTDIEYIKRGVDDLRSDNDDIKDDIRSLDHRVTLVESSVKSAQHRLDDMRKEEHHA